MPQTHNDPNRFMRPCFRKGTTPLASIASLEKPLCSSRSIQLHPITQAIRCVVHRRRSSRLRGREFACRPSVRRRQKSAGASGARLRKPNLWLLREEFDQGPEPRRQCRRTPATPPRRSPTSRLWMRFRRRISPYWLDCPKSRQPVAA